MILQFLNNHFIELFLLVGFSLKLHAQKSGSGDAQIRYFWLTVICTAVLTAAGFLEEQARLSGLIFWRLLFSVIAYVFRPVAALSIALVIYPKFHRPRFLWIPAVVNAVVYCTAFFSPVAFYIASDNHFGRGPLGYFVFYVCFLYALVILWLTYRRYRSKGRIQERTILYLCVAFCLGAAALDYLYDGTRLNIAILVSSIFLYVFLRSIDTNRDPLTKLLNRLSFYEDCERFGSAVSAVASVDMNGLKVLNDEYGHARGDKALRTIANSLRQVSSKRIIPYRIGGDEFILLFLRHEEEAVQDKLDLLKAIVRENGLSISTGYAMRSDASEKIDKLVRLSDRQMYIDKAEYYRLSSHDRRKP